MKQRAVACGWSERGIEEEKGVCHLPMHKTVLGSHPQKF